MNIDWKKMNGLIPAIVQDAVTQQVLMLGYMNEDALTQTLETRQVTFFSRSKNRLWTKGETSGNFLKVVKAEADCDSDSVLIHAIPAGPTCHRETTSCFGTERSPGLGFLGELTQVVEDRHTKMPEGSYTTTLFKDGLDRMAQKVGEEGVEVVIAAKNDDVEKFKGEAADLVFHLMVLLRAKSLSLFDVVQTLRARHQKQ